MNAILDGRTSLIVLDNRYTFTNYEFARGFISFRDGFDLPVGGTIILSLDGVAPIKNNITMNKGTILLDNSIHLNSEVTFSGDGFIVGSNATINFEQTLNFSANYMHLSGDLTFRSAFFGQIEFNNGGVIDARNLNTLEFVNCGVIDQGDRILTSTIKPEYFLFRDSYIIASLGGLTTEWLSPEIIFQGFNTIFTENKLKINTLKLNNLAQVEIQPNSELQLKKLEMPFSQSKLFLSESNLDFIQTLTNDIPIGNLTTTGQGKLILKGTSKLKSSTGNKLLLASGLGLDFFTGARLCIENNHLILQ